MFVKQSRNTYIRCTDNYGYIINQLTRLDRVYNDSGAFYLRHISRNPKHIQDIIDAAAMEFGESFRNEITKDLKIFLSNLEENKFIVTGSDEAELDEKYNRQNETCNFPKRNEQNFSFFASFFLLLFRPLKYQLNAD